MSKKYQASLHKKIKDNKTISKILSGGGKQTDKMRRIAEYLENHKTLYKLDGAFVHADKEEGERRPIEFSGNALTERTDPKVLAEKTEDDVPKDIDLYARVSFARRLINKGRTSAYSSMHLQSVYQEMYDGEGEPYVDGGGEKALIDWLEEEWVDLNRSITKTGRKKSSGWKVCGRDRKEFEDLDEYPKCVPMRVAEQMSPEERLDAVRRKHKQMKKVLQKYGLEPEDIPTVYVETDE